MRILIAEDEVEFARVLGRVLATGGHADVAIAHTAEQALAARPEPDLLITDLRLPDISGIELMRRMRERDPDLACVLMTAFADVATARSALLGGALDYLVKPFDNQELLALVGRVATRSLEAGRGMPGGLTGASPAMQRLFMLLRQAAQGDATVLLQGESGTGKELAARAIHRLGQRAGRRLVEAHLAAVPESMIENELFGHEKGAFTGADSRSDGLLAAADGGTLFLDEIGELPLHLQPKILRVVQEKRYSRIGGTAPLQVDVRIIAATNRRLADEVAAGRFRSDLFYRLDVLAITLPPLREREGDIMLIANDLLAQRRPGSCFTPAAADALCRHAWPGNVRELANAIERACVVCDGQLIDVVHLPERVRGSGSAAPEAGSLDHQRNERELIRDALARSGGNKSGAAVLLGISRRRLYSRLKILGMDDAPEEG